MGTYDTEGHERAEPARGRQPAAERRPGGPEAPAGPLDAHALASLQRKVGNAGVGAALTAQREEEAGQAVRRVVGSSGRPLGDDVRSRMEQTLGTDLSDVRVHDDAAAGESARAVQAHAYTSGSHVVFAPGRYDPGSSDGQRLLAHELTHVVQQRSGSVDGTSTAGGLKVSDPSDRFEREADRAADQVVSRSAAGLVPSGQGPHPAPAVQRDGEEEEELQASAVQRDAEEEEELQTSAVQREAEEDEGPAS